MKFGESQKEFETACRVSIYVHNIVYEYVYVCVFLLV